jgi:hypothetical protein
MNMTLFGSSIYHLKLIFMWLEKRKFLQRIKCIEDRIVILLVSFMVLMRILIILLFNVQWLMFYKLGLQIIILSLFKAIVWKICGV